jgi:hypothetical protein
VTSDKNKREPESGVARRRTRTALAEHPIDSFLSAREDFFLHDRKTDQLATAIASASSVANKD